MIKITTTLAVAFAASILLPAFAEAAPKCSTFQYWSVGQECVRKNGQTCTIASTTGGRMELRNCK